ncbi:hypothetical protein HETIRDRAFT_455326 [Heterobasidion irregulare TC 32-1]|uniref:Uncharacterized protein n=1 Tax=Heterobasidion irregulare (strain TC 32-1) TaxID=747525 RepID=W4JTM4_HETIT|nr:uncharacterized protein HETIRDRAFT_455326 [Heterobasidion irregulare TC 32-1]ETW76912.1 hypothetical protein HETIRDRAFT_455326 [Heterobasidion irregulare TC 32-1]
MSSGQQQQQQHHTDPRTTPHSFHSPRSLHSPTLSSCNPSWMRLYVAGTDALASGCVCARGVLPDVLMFDSAVPQPDAPPKMYSSNSRPRADAPLPPPQ